MLATIVRSRLALNVGGEEPERSALLRIAKLEDIPPDAPAGTGRMPTAPRSSTWARSPAMRRTIGSAVSIGAACRQRADLVLLRVD
jgi:hypothetical protein